MFQLSGVHYKPYADTLNPLLSEGNVCSGGLLLITTAPSPNLIQVFGFLGFRVYLNPPEATLCRVFIDSILGF